jgi:hypothetical protein
MAHGGSKFGFYHEGHEEHEGLFPRSHAPRGNKGVVVRKNEDNFIYQIFLNPHDSATFFELYLLSFFPVLMSDNLSPVFQMNNMGGKTD